MKQLFNLETNHNSEIDEKFHQLNIGNIGNIIYWLKYFEIVKNVPGDIVECGIGRGRSLLVISAINSILNKDEGGERNVYGYDSFEGFSEPSIEDDSYRKPKKGEWSASPSGKYEYSQEFIKLVLTEAMVPVNNLKLTKGFFGDSLINHPNNPIAILHVDGDLYQSYIDTLQNLYPKVSKGGLIVFDDFLAQKDDNERWPGARKAVEEFFGDKIENLKISERGTPYYIKD